MLSARNKKGLIRTAKKVSPPTAKKTQQLLSQYDYDIEMENSFSKLRAGELWNKVAGFNASTYQKDVVHEIMDVTREKITVSCKNNQYKEQSVAQCICPRPTKLCKLKGDPVTCSHGYTNAYKHLINCFGTEEALARNVVNAMKKTTHNAATTRENFNISAAKTIDKEIYALLDYIVEDNLPLSSVQKESVRKFGKIENKVSIGRMNDIVDRLVKTVEKKIKNDLHESGRGALMQDGWTMNGIHYIGLFAVTMRKVSTIENGKKCHDFVPQVNLLSVAPMVGAETEAETGTGNDSTGDDDEDQELADTFNSAMHVKHIKSIMEDFYGMDDVKFAEWTKCLIQDNCATNLKVARLLKLPHVPCGNHLFNRDIEDWLKNDPELREVIEKVHGVMLQLKNSLKFGNSLKKYSNRRPQLHNKTRWSSKRGMLDSFDVLNEFLPSVKRDHQDFDLHGTTAPQFILAAQKYLKQMVELDTVMKKIQTRAMKYEEARDYFNTLIATIENGKDDESSIFYGCTFEAKRIKTSYTALHPNADFENGVEKIQRGLFEQMTEAEKAACNHLRLDFRVAGNNDDENESDENESDNESESSSDDEGISDDEMSDDEDEGEDEDKGNIMEKVEQLREKRQNERNNLNIYGNCDFILGSAAEVERLWSLCKHVLTTNRLSMEPSTFESLMFLKLNRAYWGLEDVIKADTERKQEKRAANMEEKKKARLDEDGKKKKKKRRTNK